MKDHEHEFPVKIMARVLGLSRSGYYAWRDRPSSALAARRARLVTQIRHAHAESHETYGSPRVHRELQARAAESGGEACCENTVAKLMREQGIRSKMRRRFVVRTTDSKHAHVVAENILDRQFDQELPNQAWAADITYIASDEGWLYLAAVIDLCSRRIVGWATADHLQAELCVEALQNAVFLRGPAAGLVHHSEIGRAHV